MSNSVIKSLSINDCEFPTGPCKKRRRHRNRYKNYNLKRKRLKKCVSTSKTGSQKSDIFNFKTDIEKIMSNWYWSNYSKAVEWQERHKVAQWKACALALFEENRYLLGIINRMRPDMVSRSSATPQVLGRGSNFNTKQKRKKYSKYFPAPVQNNNVDENGSCSNQDENNAQDDNSAEDDFEFEMSEEMMQFFEQSYKHKMDMKKLKEKEVMNNIEQQVQQIQNNKIKRSSEMNFLYGEGASMITGMETAVQLSFNKYCDINSPNYWPNIPFRL